MCEYAPLVSVIIPTKNNEKTLTKCLFSIKQQIYPNIEIIIIDAFSTDQTRSLAERFGAQVMQLQNERTKAKNYGAQLGKGDYIFFVDSDMILEPTVVRECLDACIKGTIGVIIPEASVGSGFWVRIRDFERSMYQGTKIESARFFVRKHVLEVGGFDEDIIAYEESTLPQKLERRGYKVNARIKSFILHNEDGFELKKWLRKKRYYSDTLKIYAERYPEYAREQLRVKNRIKILLSNGNLKRLIRHPIPAFGVLVLKSLEYAYFSCNTMYFYKYILKNPMQNKKHGLIKNRTDREYLKNNRKG
jgi:glycosyltransferase involved in cell wall biosynthesis